MKINHGKNVQINCRENAHKDKNGKIYSCKNKLVDSIILLLMQHIKLTSQFGHQKPFNQIQYIHRVSKNSVKLWFMIISSPEQKAHR